MFQRRIVTLFILLLTLHFDYAQVNLQTGSATFSLPMFNWQDDKSRLNALVALSYNSGSGLRVNDVASNVGQGWSLVAGGVITRIQVGEPDDQVGRDGTDLDITKYPAGYFYSGVPAYNGCPNSLTNYPIFGSQNQVYAQHLTTGADKQQDYFSFSFNGKAGTFILDTLGGNHGIPVGDTKMTITFTNDPTMINQGIRTTITSFTIQDVDGLIYKFTQHGLTKVLFQNFCDKNFTAALVQPTLSNSQVYHQAGFDGQYVNPYIIGSWYLSEIDDPFTSRKVNFYYEVLNINNVAAIDIAYNHLDDYTIVSHKTSMTTTPELDSIYFPDGHKVVINHGNPRVDLLGTKAISSVDISYSGRFLSEYQINTSYFIGNRYGTPITTKQKSLARLCLRSVKKIGVDLKEDSPPYIFDYYLGSSGDDVVPAPFAWAKDIWGFYNGGNSKDINGNAIDLKKSIWNISNNEAKGLCFLISGGGNNINLNPKSGYAKNGLLKQIIYPTGGTLTYSYAQNTGVLNGTSTTVGGIHVTQTSSTDGGNSNGCSAPIVTQYNYVNSAGTTSSMWGLEVPVNTITQSNHYQPEWRDWHITWQCLPPLGCCYWHFAYPGILAQSQATSLSDMEIFMNNWAPVLGIVTIVSNVMDIVTVACGSVGFLSWAAVVVDIIGGLLQIGFTCFGSGAKDNSYDITYNSDLNGVSPLPAQFNRVEVVENPGTIGKTVYQFTDNNLYPLWFSSNQDLSAKQRYAPWAYGLPWITTVYDASGNKVKETQNHYSFQFAQELIDQYLKGNGNNTSGIQSSLTSCKCMIQKSSSQRNSTWSTASEVYNMASLTGVMSVDFYGIYTGRTELDTTYERVYSTTSPSQYVETVTSYHYNYNHNFDVQQITTTQSNGDVNTKYISYSSDYTGGVINTLLQNNIVSLPISTITSIYKAGGASGTQDLSEKVTEFTQVATGDIKPSRILEQRFVQPIAQTSMTNYGGPGSNTSYYKVPQIFTYDANGNLTGIKDEGFRTVTNIYDYNDKYITASVINADPVLDKPAYSSFETTDLSRSGWTVTGTLVLATGSSTTGTNSCTLSAGKSFSANLNTARPYIVSFWSTAGLTVTGGATLAKSGPTYNGFTYYEYNIAQGTTSVSVSGTGNVDELRLYPKTSRMRTTTYDPLIGKTSECDENNRITYYEYDNLGRLLFIKDENKYAVKMYEYNNVSASKQNGCPGTYSNNAIAEVFTRSNCATNFRGGDTVVTIPTGRYTSAISQADADAQAELDLLTNGQNYANTNGTCSQIYYSAARSVSDTTQNCTTGYKGSGVVYSIPAGRYTSIISQADADAFVTTELNANAQAYANSPAHQNCVVSTDPAWTFLEGAASYCLSVGGALPPHYFVFQTDINPNSSTYNQTRWFDAGPQDACPAGNYYNASQSQVFTRNNCGVGYSGTQVTYTVPPGKYFSTVSQAAADLQATNEMNANGQNNANTSGSCVLNRTITYNDSRAFDYSIRFTNNSTGMIYNFTANANSSGTLGQVPSGTYTVYICPNNNYVANNNYTVFGFTQSSVICATFNNISVNANGSISLF